MPSRAITRRAATRRPAPHTHTYFDVLLRSHGVGKKMLGKRKPTKGGNRPLILICIQLVQELLSLPPLRPWRSVVAERVMTAPRWTVARADHEILPHSRRQHHYLLPAVDEPLSAVATVPKNPPRRRPHQLLLLCSQANRL